MNATNSPLDQWQIDHIRKMKQELGMPQSAPNAEEVTMDGEDTETDMPTGGLDYAQAQQDYELASQKVRDQIQSHIDVLEGARGKLRERRVGPSDSEKWLAIAAALGQPTRTGAFGESLGNLAQTLGAQKSARREAEEKRPDAREVRAGRRYRAPAPASNGCYAIWAGATGGGCCSKSGHAKACC